MNIVLSEIIFVSYFHRGHLCVEVGLRHGAVRFLPDWLFLDGTGVALSVEFDHAVALRVFDAVAEGRGVRRVGNGNSEYLGQVVAGREIISLS